RFSRPWVLPKKAAGRASRAGKSRKRGRRRVRLCATTFTARHLLVVEWASRKTGNTGRSGARRPGDLPPCVPDTPHLCLTPHAGFCLAYPTGTGGSPPGGAALIIPGDFW